MPSYRVIDPNINAVYGTFVAPSEAAALNAAVRQMGWDNYADYVSGGATLSPPDCHGIVKRDPTSQQVSQGLIRLIIGALVIVAAIFLWVVLDLADMARVYADRPAG